MTIAELRARAEAAQRAFEEGRAKLFRKDGGQIYADPEHNERLAALRNQRALILREVNEKAAAELERAQADLTALENGDVTSLLSDPELERANARRALIADDVASLTQGELINRLEAVLHGGDRVSMFCYLQQGRRWVRERREGAAPETLGAPQSSMAAVPPELSQVLEDLAEALIPNSRKAELEAARQRIQNAGEVRDFVWLTLRDQTTAYSPVYAVPGR